jgi:small ligand-binding sensory domain FIST
LLADPFSFPVPHLLAGLDYAYPGSVKLGGLASGARQPGQNALYLDDAMQETGAVGVALAGNLRVSTIVAQGCRPVGEPLRITACRDNILLELENQPALNAIKKLMPRLSSRDRQLASQALFVGVVMDELSGEAQAGDFLIRNIVGLDADSGALAVGELLRDGQVIQFHVRDAETAAEDLNLLLGRFAQEPQAQTVHGALLFSCLGRGVHLYGRADHDTETFQERVGDVPLGGFFCNGEIGPVAGATYLHGFTSAFGIFGPDS